MVLQLDGTMQLTLFIKSICLTVEHRPHRLILADAEHCNALAIIRLNALILPSRLVERLSFCVRSRIEDILHSLRRIKAEFLRSLPPFQSRNACNEQTISQFVVNTGIRCAACSEHAVRSLLPGFSEISQSHTDLVSELFSKSQKFQTAFKWQNESGCRSPTRHLRFAP